MLSLNDTSTNEICSLTSWNLKSNSKAKQQNSNFPTVIEWKGRVVQSVLQKPKSYWKSHDLPRGETS